MFGHKQGGGAEMHERNLTGRRRPAAVAIAALSIMAVIATGAGASSATRTSHARSGATTSAGALPIASNPFLYRSQAPQLSYWAQNPSAAPARFAEALKQLKSAAAPSLGNRRAGSSSPSFVAGVQFNKDGRGLSQNEEAVDVCGSNVRGRTTDYRGPEHGN